jgi:hypothetical protein
MSLLKQAGRQVGKVGGAIGGLLTGPDDPNLSPEQNAAARKEALIHAGLAGLISSGPSASPPGLGQIFAQMALSGRGAGASARQNTQGMMQQQAMKQALQDPNLVGRLTPQQLAVIQSLPPEEALKVLQEVAFAPTPEPKVVGEGGALVGADGTPLYERPKDPTLPTELNALLWGAGVDPSQLTPEQKQQLVDRYTELARARGTTVNVNTGDQTAKGVVDIALDDYRSVVERAGSANELLATSAELQRLLDEGVRTGTTTDLTLPLRRIASEFGIANAERLGPEEAFRALANNLAIGQSSRLRGPISEKELRFITQTVPQLGTTPDGNKMILEITRRLAARDIALAQLANQYIAQNGTLDHRWFQFKQEWIQNQDMFEDLSAPAPWRR